MLNEMEHKYSFCGCKAIVNMKDKIQFDNGDTWYARTANWHMTHGQRCHIGYIDSSIHPDIVQSCVIPCCCLPPFNAIHYFNYDIETFDGDE